jgi:topoisomerase-4 subunit A
MPRKKTSKPDQEQPELPLGNGAAIPAPSPEAAAPQGAQGGAAPQAEGAAHPPVASDAESPAPAPQRRGGDSVQTEDSPLANSYRSWFLDYASYVILDRAVPHLDDGLKPVQRRILHTFWDMDDGRFHKVANIVGRTACRCIRTATPRSVRRSSASGSGRSSSSRRAISATC